MTKEETMSSALRFRKLSHWDKADHASVYAARINGWLEECTAHMDPIRRISTPHRLTDEEIIGSSSSCLFKSEWHRRDSRAYQAAKLRGLFGRCTAHMLDHKPKLSETELKNKAVLCKTAEEFKEKFPVEYHSASASRRLLGRVTSHVLPSNLFAPDGSGRCGFGSQPIFVVIGVSGVGKSWVCSRLDKFHYVSYDKLKTRDDRVTAIAAATWEDKPVVFDPVVHVSSYLKKLPSDQTYVVCIIEDEQTIRSRLLGRRSVKGLTEAGLSRMKRIQWYADRKAKFSGTSSQVLDWIKSQVR